MKLGPFVVGLFAIVITSSLIRQIRGRDEEKLGSYSEVKGRICARLRSWSLSKRDLLGKPLKEVFDLTHVRSRSKKNANLDRNASISYSNPTEACTLITTRCALS